MTAEAVIGGLEHELLSGELGDRIAPVVAVLIKGIGGEKPPRGQGNCRGSGHHQQQPNNMFRHDLYVAKRILLSHRQAEHKSAFSLPVTWMGPPPPPRGKDPRPSPLDARQSLSAGMASFVDADQAFWRRPRKTDAKLQRGKHGVFLTAAVSPMRLPCRGRGPACGTGACSGCRFCRACSSNAWRRHGSQINTSCRDRLIEVPGCPETLLPIRMGWTRKDRARSPIRQAAGLRDPMESSIADPLVSTRNRFESRTLNGCKITTG